MLSIFILTFTLLLTCSSRRRYGLVDLGATGEEDPADLRASSGRSEYQRAMYTSVQRAIVLQRNVFGDRGHVVVGYGLYHIPVKNSLAKASGL